ncbi:hypothetical protein LNKW23_37200 [Paralimibaculum aggregatum]|uniref:Uncharacterized protein n=1 Tax=Paralimibaculum aggregatum TaxID=3036245 RepID=A0ABQ6LPR1_9RHOB|nr:hypothetical protein LNKW23_37200 [Limibaculum sp. NKW23]
MGVDCTIAVQIRRLHPHQTGDIVGDGAVIVDRVPLLRAVMLRILPVEWFAWLGAVERLCRVLAGALHGVGHRERRVWQGRCGGEEQQGDDEPAHGILLGVIRISAC